MEESKEGNVFAEITGDIPRARYDGVIERFKEKEHEFIQYLDSQCEGEAYLGGETSSAASSELLKEICEVSEVAGVRGICATNLIPKSSLVLDSDPIVSHLGTDSIPRYCSCCFKPSKSLK
jgi:hypothetical protein